MKVSYESQLPFDRQWWSSVSVGLIKSEYVCSPSVKSCYIASNLPATCMFSHFLWRVLLRSLPLLRMAWPTDVTTQTMILPISIELRSNWRRYIHNWYLLEKSKPEVLLSRHREEHDEDPGWKKVPKPTGRMKRWKINKISRKKKWKKTSERVQCSTVLHNYFG